MTTKIIKLSNLVAGRSCRLPVVRCSIPAFPKKLWRDPELLDNIGRQSSSSGFRGRTSSMTRRAMGDGASEAPAVVIPTVAGPGSLIVCPVTMPMGGWGPSGSAADLYRLAYQQALAAIQPSWFERVLLTATC